MCVRSLYLLLVAALGAQAQWRFQPPKLEAEECGRIGDQVWTCQRESVCSSSVFLASRSNIITCNTDQGVKVVCCPSSQVDANRGADTVSEKKCQEYRASLALSNRMDGELLQANYDSLFPGLLPDEADNGIIQRRKRGSSDGEAEQFTDETNIFVNETEDDLNPDVAILGGELAKAKELPHSALIGYLLNQSIISWNCGGTLISETFVLSAAHCASAEGLSDAYVVRLGDLDLSRTDDDARPQDILIAETISHPDYESDTFYNDIALFRLERAVVFSEYMAPACLHTSTSDPFGMATASGWGKTGMNNPTNNQLRKVNLAFISCILNPRASPLLALQLNQRLPRGVDQQTMVCAWAEGKDACNGDSGGPLILADWQGSRLPRLVGVTSFGRTCMEGSTSDDPGYYMRVAAFAPWIESMVWPNDSRS